MTSGESEKHLMTLLEWESVRSLVSYSLEADLSGWGPSHFSPATEKKWNKKGNKSWASYANFPLNLSTVTFELHVGLDSFLTNAVCHELKSVRSKKHLWLSIDVAHQKREAKRLGRHNRTDHCIARSRHLLPRNRTEAQRTPWSRAFFVALFSLSLISFELDSSSTSLISPSDNPAFIAACIKEKEKRKVTKRCGNSKPRFLIFLNPAMLGTLVPLTMMTVLWYLCPPSRSFSTVPGTPAPLDCPQASPSLVLQWQIA